MGGLVQALTACCMCWPKTVPVPDSAEWVKAGCAHTAREFFLDDSDGLDRVRLKARKSYLTTAQFAILNDACIPIAEAFDSEPYLVGSATERADYRDIDLRLILTDEDFDHWFRGRVMLWSLVCLTIGQHLRAVTGLPVDFQIQRMTEANEKHPTTRRNPMGMRSRPLAGGGDATNFG